MPMEPRKRPKSKRLRFATERSAAALLAIVSASCLASCSTYELDQRPGANFAGFDGVVRFSPDGAGEGPKFGQNQDAATDSATVPSAQPTTDVGTGEGVADPDPAPEVYQIPNGDQSDVGGADDEAGDAADASEGVSGPPPVVCATKPCSADSQCQGGGVCEAAACADGCCAVLPKPEGAACDDGDACTVLDACGPGGCIGKKTDCDDGIACTADACAAATGKCGHTLQPGWCLIDGACVADGTAKADEPCKVCQAKSSNGAWAKKPACCTADAECPAPGSCDLPACDLTTGACGVKKKLGCCLQNDDCNDGNACTADKCDVATGACSIAPKNCPAGLSCQNAACNPATGKCETPLKAGFCLIGGKCRQQGETAEGNACLVCQPSASTQDFVAASGVFCDDGDPCTYDDVCGAGGSCKGKPKPGCCKADGDCGSGGDPCKVGKCNVASLTCAFSDKAGCCTSGTCCDVVNHTVKPAKAPCGDAVIAPEWKCDGQTAMKRETAPGCSGLGPDACSPSTTYAAVGSWQAVKTCPSGTACKLAGSSQQPTCEATGPVGTCQGACGGKAKDGTCWCDSACTGAKDCCKDFLPLCGCSSGECCDVAKQYPKSAGSACGTAKTEWKCVGQQLQSRSGNATCDGKNTCQSNLNWSSWSAAKTCPVGTNCASSPSGDCKPIPAGSCKGKCGGQSSGTCWCDKLCVELGDCCADYQAYGCAPCGHDSGKTCGGGACGKQLPAACWCDDACDLFGDCCPDKNGCGC
jgi:hypothetical protein